MLLSRILVVAPAVLVMAESGALAGLYWTSYVSEESGAYALCDESTDGAVGFRCSGRYCDNVSLLCETFPFGALAPSWNGYVTAYFSEEHDPYGTWFSSGWYPWDDENYEVCHNQQTTPGVVTGIGCSGSYCDNISIECRQPEVAGVKLAATNCSWSGWISEEQGSVDFGWNRYITGVECNGSRCDNKRFYVCSLQ
jgi:hypothetical protein